MKKFLLSSILVFGAILGFAQGRVIFNYNPSITIGSANTFIGDISWRGSNLDFRFEMNDNIEVGGLIGWNYLYERKDRAVYEENIDGRGLVQVSAVQSRYLNIIPLTAQAFYYLKSEERSLIPYGGLNIGGYRVDYEKYWGDILDEHEQWSFGLAPSVGFLLPLGSNYTALNVQARYNFIVFDYNEINNISYFDLSVGLSFNM